MYMPPSTMYLFGIQYFLDVLNASPTPLLIIDNIFGGKKNEYDEKTTFAL